MGLEEQKGYGITSDCISSPDATRYQEVAHYATNEELRRLGVIFQTSENSDNF